MVRKVSRGSVLTFVVVVGAILLIGVAAMFASMNATMATSEAFYTREEAKSVCRSAIQLALAPLRKGDLEFREDVSFIREGQLPAHLTFSQDSGRPYSTNNLSGTSSVRGWGNLLVPPKCIHLVAVAGQEDAPLYVHWMLIKLDSLPWSVASNGTIQGNDMEVFSIETQEEARDGVTEEEKQKSDILSNSSGAGNGNSIELSGSSKITGDAKAVAGISLLDSSTVEGKVQANADSVNITLDKRAEDYRPATGTSNVFDPSSSAPITGVYEASGDTVIGNLTFEDGMIFIDGNVTVSGDISGVGALVATGDITITGSMNTSADLAALVSGGDISITGVGPNSSSFQGLILAEGSFKAKDTTLIGSALTLDQNGSVELERVRAVAAKDLTKVDLSHDVVLKDILKTNAEINFPGGEIIGIEYDGGFTAVTESNYDSLQALALQIAADNSAGQVVIKDSLGNPLTSPPPSLLQGFVGISNLWGTYETQVKTGTVERREVFQLDFNKFLKTKGGFRPLRQEVVRL